MVVVASKPRDVSCPTYFWASHQHAEQECHAASHQAELDFATLPN